MIQSQQLYFCSSCNQDKSFILSFFFIRLPYCQIANLVKHTSWFIQSTLLNLQTLRSKLPHALGLLSVERLDIDLVRQDGSVMMLPVNVIGRHVQHRDYFGRVSHDLIVQISLEGLDVGQVDHQERLLRYRDLKYSNTFARYILISNGI